MRNGYDIVLWRERAFENRLLKVAVGLLGCALFTVCASQLSCPSMRAANLLKMRGFSRVLRIVRLFSQVNRYINVIKQTFDFS